MLILGFVLVLLGYWFLPSYVPQGPGELYHLMYGFGLLLLIIGAVFWILGLVGHPIGGRRYWY
jgi:hypothetical protein